MIDRNFEQLYLGRNDKHHQLLYHMEFTKELFFIAFALACGFGHCRLLNIIQSEDSPCSEKVPCVTLSQFAANSSWLEQNTYLLFTSPGNYTLSKTVFISNTDRFSMLSGGNTETFILCENNASLKLEHIQEVRIKGVWFVGCGGNKIYSVNELKVESCTFQGQSGSETALHMSNTNVTIENTHFVSNTKGSCLHCHHRGDISYQNGRFVQGQSNRVYYGGAMIVQWSNATIKTCTFEGNEANIGGAIHSGPNSHITIILSHFIQNYAQILNNVNAKHRKTILSYGGAITAYRSTVVIKNSTFKHNTCINGDGGSVSLETSNMTISNSIFVNNSASSQSIRTYGGAVRVRKANHINIVNCTFLNSSAHSGGAINVVSCLGKIVDSKFIDNTAEDGGAIDILTSFTFTVSNTVFLYNAAVYGGAFNNIKSMVQFTDCSFTGNSAKYVGGAVNNYYEGVLNFTGKCKFTHNRAMYGGALFATVETTIYVLDMLVIDYNRAGHSGGGLFLDLSNLHCLNRCKMILRGNSAIKKGGGVDLITTKLSIHVNRSSMNQPSVVFSRNRCNQSGGGVSLQSGSQLIITKYGNAPNKSAQHNSYLYLRFIKNTARRGAAVFIRDETNFEMCSPSSVPTTESQCFMQVLSPQKTFFNNLVSVDFESKSKSTIFGGLLDRCTVAPFSEIATKHDRIQVYITGIEYLMNTSTLKSLDLIRSKTVRLCFCNENGPTNHCSTSMKVSVKRGENFSVSLAALDQVNHTLSNVLIHSALRNRESGLGSGQIIKKTQNSCTNLNFYVYSPQASETLKLFAESPCRPKVHVNITFLQCQCPVGFQPYEGTRGETCKCVCDSRLKDYFSAHDCNSSTGKITRKGNFWITNITSNSSNEGYLIEHYCPYDYCVSLESHAKINLNVSNGSDAQCAHNRSGLLCSVCKPGTSLSLGTSHCIPCSGHWQVPTFLAIAFVSGLLLVVLIMALNLTVASGVLDGIIFYANIIDANHSVYFSTPTTRFFSVFISWLNLDIGFDVCFFEGMTTYWKTWLQLAFPTYVILLVFLIIFISEKSLWFSKLLAKRNPVATLATLILLSYTKYLRNGISVLSYRTLGYPNTTQIRIWTPDATISFLCGKHIALFVVTLIISLIGILFTIIVFLWQWLLRCSDIFLFCWIKNTKLTHFIEPYHVPYIDKHRYWTGLLLLIRALLYFLLSWKASSDPGVSLGVVIVLITLIMMLKGCFGSIYKNKIIDSFELLLYVHILLLSAVALYIHKAKNRVSDHVQPLVANTSAIAAFIHILLALMYHLYLEFSCLKLGKMVTRDRNKTSVGEINDYSVHADPINPPGTTYSVIGFAHEQSSDIENDDNDSTISDDFNAPLLAKK